MIGVIMNGRYRLVATQNDTKILYLDDTGYVWMSVGENWEILETTYKVHQADRILGVGKYVLYEVDDEPYLADLQHLEIEHGTHAWQGYLLPTGLPDIKKRRSRIIPTTELITGIPYFSKKFRLVLPTIVIPHHAAKRHAIGGRTWASP